MAASDHISGDQVEASLGFRSDHKNWRPLEEHRDLEIERGNEFPDISGYPEHEAIWVTHTEDDARRYGDSIYEVDISGSTKLVDDEDGGYLYVRPKKEK